MRVSLVTAPTIEPIDKDELKLHLRLDSGSFADNIDETQSIAPGSHAKTTGTTYNITGDAVEVLGYTALVQFQAGTNGAGGTVDVKIQECDTLAGTYTDWTGGAFTQVTESGTGTPEPDNATYEKAYTGTKRYIKTVALVLVAACEFGTTIIRLTATSVEDDLLTGDIETARRDVENDTSRAIITQTWDYFLQSWPSGDRIKIPFGNLQTVSYIKWKDTDGVETNLMKTVTAFAASSISPATKTQVTSAAHGFVDGDLVFISGTTSYNGAWTISNVATNAFDITAVFVADDVTGTATTDYIVETNGDQCGFVVLPYGGTWPSSGTLYPSNPITIRFVCGYGATAATVPATIKSAIKMRCSKLYENRGEDIVGLTVHLDDTYWRLINNVPRLYDEFE